jgi:hypothetical protein
MEGVNGRAKIAETKEQGRHPPFNITNPAIFFVLQMHGNKP